MHSQDQYTIAWSRRFHDWEGKAPSAHMPPCLEPFARCALRGGTHPNAYTRLGKKGAQRSRGHWKCRDVTPLSFSMNACPNYDITIVANIFRPHRSFQLVLLVTSCPYIIGVGLNPKGCTQQSQVCANTFRRQQKTRASTGDSSTAVPSRVTLHATPFRTPSPSTSMT